VLDGLVDNAPVVRSGIERVEALRDEKPFAADQLAVEVDLPTTGSPALIADDVPVVGRLVPVRRLLIAPAGRQVEASTDLLVEQRFADHTRDEVVDAEGEFAEVAGTLVGVQEGVQRRLVTRLAGRLHDLARLDHEAEIGEPLAAGVDRGGVVGDHAVHGIANRRREHFAVGDVVRSGTGDDRNSLDAESEIGVARPLDLDLVGPLHQGDERLHGLGHGAVVGEACLEEELFELRRGHPGQLGVGRRRPAGQHPAGAFHALFNRQRNEHLAVALHVRCRHVVAVELVTERPELNEAVGGSQLGKLAGAPGTQLVSGATPECLEVNARIVAPGDHGAPRFAHGLDHREDHVGRHYLRALDDDDIVL